MRKAWVRRHRRASSRRGNYLARRSITVQATSSRECLPARSLRRIPALTTHRRHSSGILSALARRQTEGGSYLVTTSLLDTAILLRSLGSRPFPPDSSSLTPALETPDDLRARGRLGVCVGRGGKQVEYVKHAAVFDQDSVQVGWEQAPERMGADEAEWLPF